MATIQNAEPLLGLLHETVASLVRRKGPDLTSRQLCVFLTCYLEDDAQTVRGLATALNISRPVISRALNWLGQLDLARRKPDPSDRRSVLVQRTQTGTAFLRELRAILAKAASGQDAAPKSRSSSPAKAANG